MGSTGAFIRDTAALLSERLVDAEQVAGYLESFDSTPLEEIEEAFAFPDSEGIDLQERRARVLQEVQGLQAKYRLQVTSSLREWSLFLKHRSRRIDPETNQICSSCRCCCTGATSTTSLTRSGLHKILRAVDLTLALAWPSLYAPVRVLLLRPCRRLMRLRSRTL